MKPLAYKEQQQFRFKTIAFFCHSCQAPATIEYEPSDFSPWESFCVCTGCGFEWFQSTESLLKQENADD